MMIFRRSLAEVWTSAGFKRNQYTVCVDDLLSLRRCLQNVKKNAERPIQTFSRR